ncbi:DUF58 domain-containing protein [Rhabdothermincola sediminis]|uniref:DUF58 domain-containing protein n=1 Tax=Rhabdothermincola sediminis TaxID=2751370 RepID=UPI001AA0A894|nr:DUF58 domain-containing protein [Rhabdothermincola sediminis]
MLTRRGWLTLLAAGLSAAAGRLSGAEELYVLAAMLACLVAGAAVYARLTPLAIEVTRELHPSRVHAGSASRVDLVVTNRGRRRSPLLDLHDAVSGTRGANLVVPPLPPTGAARAAYRLPTKRRGILTIGPLQAVLSDPFGLTAITTQASEVTQLTVYPHVDQITPVPQTTGNDPMAGAEHPNALGRGGEDFYALRPYVVGDDLRRVHWPSTARHDELMVRQDELPWQGRATVLLDVRSATNTAESLELVVSAAASIISASSGRQDLVRLLSTDGSDSGFAAGHAHVESMLEYLAGVEMTNEANYRRVLDRLARSSGGGALVVVVALAPPEDLDRLTRLRGRFGSLTIVSFEPSSWGGTGPDSRPALLPRSGTTLVRVSPDQSFAETWNRAVRPRRQEPGRWRATGRGRAGEDPDRWARHERVLR